MSPSCLRCSGTVYDPVDELALHSSGLLCDDERVPILIEIEVLGHVFTSLDFIPKRNLWEQFRNNTLLLLLYKVTASSHDLVKLSLGTAEIQRTADFKAAVTPDLERKSDEDEDVNIEERSAYNDSLNFAEEAGPSKPTPSLSYGLETQLLLLDKKSNRDTVEEPEKEELEINFQQIRALETTNDEEVARKIQAEWDAEEERKRFEELKKTKPKTTLRKPTSLAQERNQMMSFLKGQGYKNLQKLKYPQMKELYDKVQASIKDSFKDFIPMDSEKEREMLKERDAKRLLRKRKATIAEEQPSKKPKLRTETIDELRNYLRVVDFEKCAQERESLEGISMITELQVIDSPDGEYLINWYQSHGALDLGSTRVDDKDARSLALEVEDENEQPYFDNILFILWTTEDGDNS
ncbi:hypothetical protein Tco_1032906 [Tanacetum coccineum]|uniref:Uncharacterized protein n=1 Tax=Tanacetum coccineum TaxID=301880 RepID=A0ABQ5GEJ6_9ASTR